MATPCKNATCFELWQSTLSISTYSLSNRKHTAMQACACELHAQLFLRTRKTRRSLAWRRCRRCRLAAANPGLARRHQTPTTSEALPRPSSDLLSAWRAPERAPPASQQPRAAAAPAAQWAGPWQRSPGGQASRGSWWPCAAGAVGRWPSPCRPPSSSSRRTSCECRRSRAASRAGG